MHYKFTSFNPNSITTAVHAYTRFDQRIPMAGFSLLAFLFDAVIKDQHSENNRYQDGDE